ncbi:unnamed protein product [Prorocentrum cordatum]|uniref:Uncharacterized protein n=1 Tax=Prorocentrum cordatum TaxID=2364126 RepID=A0ABN9TG78_9DINO|nr:unnamed protein product [Polarella glacialis]
MAASEQSQVELQTARRASAPAAEQAPQQAAPPGEPLLVGSGVSSPSRPPLARAVASERVRVGPHRIQTWNDDLYAQLRERDGVPEGFLESLDISRQISKDP